MRKVLENLADYSRQEAFLEKEYATIKVYEAIMTDGVYVSGELIESVTVEPIEYYPQFLNSLD